MTIWIFPIKYDADVSEIYSKFTKTIKYLVFQ